MGVYVDAADILVQAGVSAPSAAESAWADTVEDAIEGAIAHALDDGAFTPTSSQTAALTAAAMLDALALFEMRSAPHGVLSITPDGEVARLGADPLRASRTVLYPINPGIG
jgi:hypothetical protein